MLRAFVAGLLLAPVIASAQGTADGTVQDPRPAEQTQGTSADAAEEGTAPSASTPSADTAPVATDPAPASGASAQTPQTPQGATGGTATGGASGASQPMPSQSGSVPTTQTAAPEPAQIDPGTTTANAVTPQTTSALVLSGAIALVLAIVPFGFFLLARTRRKEPTLSKEEEARNRCLDIEHLMKDKLRELTDLRAMAKEKTVEMGKELMRDLVTGTKTGDLLVSIEKAEAQYNKLKKLFEECQIDIDRYKYKGVLIENSLLNKEILKEVRVVRTREAGAWLLHDIRLSKKQIADIQKNIVDTKWFFHLWEPGKDTVTVVFKDAIFDVKHSDRTTWQEAIKHGLTRGIPQEQLTFEIVQ